MNVRRLDMETPLGVVHMVAFPKGGEGAPSHREVIFEILSEYTGRNVTAENLKLSHGLLDSSAENVQKPATDVSSREATRPTFSCLDFDVNWTHSGNDCVVAFGERGSLVNGVGLHLGVDMEVHKPKRLRVAERFYSPEENLHLETLDESRRLQEFYRLWCRKEAFFKCAGGSFFEGAVGRNVLDNPLSVGPFQVFFVDVPWEDGTSLCLAVCKD